MVMRMMQQQQQQGGQPPQQPGQPPGAAAPKIPTAFVVNQRENSILATAPADKMAIIAQVIKAVNVATANDSPETACQTQVYRLTGVDPEPIIQTLEETARLSPSCHLKGDKKNKLIIADASPADQATIRALVDRLCGSDRQFEVIRLRWLRAEAVAPSVEFGMGVNNKKKADNHHYWGWSPWDEDSSSSNEKSNEFRVQPDIEHNRLILWANEIEIGQVKDLLVKLGEKPRASGDKIKHVTIDGGTPRETEELLRRLRVEWPLVAPNPLSPLPPATNKDKAETAPPKSTPEAELPPTATKTTAVTPPGTMVRLTELRRNVTEEEGVEPSAKSDVSAPIDVRVGPDGKLVVSSKDVQAPRSLRGVGFRIGRAAQGIHALLFAPRLGHERGSRSGRLFQGGAAEEQGQLAILYP